MYEDEKPWLETRNLGGCFKSTGIALLIIAAIIFFASCARIIGAEPATLVSYQKIKHSTYFVITVQPKDSCVQYVSYWNGHCFRCEDAEVPERWNVVKYGSGKYFSEPIK